VRVAVVGKGGAGKSLIAGTMARLIARRGHRVLALDSDMLPGLALSLGAEEPAEPPLNAAAERDEDGRWRLRPGIGPVRAIRRYCTVAPDGVRLLQAGKASPAGLGPVMGAIHAFHRLIHRLDEPVSLRSWAVVGDLPAGPRQAAFGWAPYAEHFLLVVEPTWQSMMTARRVARIACARREDATVSLIVNKVAGEGDVARVEQFLGVRALARVPRSDEAREAERMGAALLDHAPGSEAVRAVDGLVERLLGAEAALAGGPPGVALGR
jgi:CO dehydrogenase maturation factor